MMRPPPSLPPTTANNPLTVTLLLGSFVHSPRQVELFDMYLPPSQPPPQHPEEYTFHPLPEIVHTFRPEQKTPPSILPAVFTGLVVAPWVVLLGLVSTMVSFLSDYSDFIRRYSGVVSNLLFLTSSLLISHPSLRQLLRSKPSCSGIGLT